MKIKTALAVGLAMALACVLGVAFQLSSKAFGASNPAFTLQSRVIHINIRDGSQSETQETRYVSSSGSYRVVNTDAGRRGKEYFFERGRGFFNVNHQEKVLVPDAKMSPDARKNTSLTVEQLVSNPQFMRKEVLLGLTAYVFRVTDEQTGRPISETYYAVETGTTPLKVVVYNGGKISMVSEPVNITWGEPDPSLIKGPGYPVAR